VFQAAGHGFLVGEVVVFAEMTDVANLLQAAGHPVTAVTTDTFTVAFDSATNPVADAVGTATPLAYTAPTTATVSVVPYVANTGKHCPTNLQLSALADVAMDGSPAQEIQQHQCHSKCVANAPCTGDNCFCDGLLSGFDTVTSNALCLSQTLCEFFCDQLGPAVCGGIDMHQTKNRCFLNPAGTCAALADDANYKWLVRQADADILAAAGAPPVPDTVAVVQQDLGWSWEHMLRFFPVEFSTAGTYKVCFCDAEIVGGTCRTEADYLIEIGTVHVSGVSCLLQDRYMQKAACCRQYWPAPASSNGRGGTDGTFRCYRGLRTCPEVTLPQYPANLVLPSGPVAADADENPLHSWCLLGPEELTQNEPQCQLVAGFPNGR